VIWPRPPGLASSAPGYEPGSSGLPYNTIVVSDRTGALVATYRKMHLYDRLLLPGVELRDAW